MSELSPQSAPMPDQSPEMYSEVWNILSEGQRERMLAGPGWVSDPAEMHQFISIDDFRCHEAGDNGQDGSNNFRFHFAEHDEESIMAVTYGKIPAIQRLKIIDPAKCAEVQTMMTCFNSNPTSDSNWQLLLDTYRLVSLLVDKNDPHVCNSHAGGDVDPLILTR